MYAVDAGGAKRHRGCCLLLPTYLSKGRNFVRCRDKPRTWMCATSGITTEEKASSRMHAIFSRL
jgi:hypothetical protein